MIDIKDTSSVFQLAFGLNAVIMVIFKNSYQKRKEFCKKKYFMCGTADFH